MHDPTWFTQMEREQAEREDYREQVAWERDHQLQAQRSARVVRWMCPFCYQEIDEHAPHCGEAGRAVPMTEEEEQ